mgnify:CR=1 FL=1
MDAAVQGQGVEAWKRVQQELGPLQADASVGEGQIGQPIENCGWCTQRPHPTRRVSDDHDHTTSLEGSGEKRALEGVPVLTEGMTNQRDAQRQSR